MVTTHVLDAALGRPAEGMRVRLERADGTVVATAVTDSGGRAKSRQGSPSFGGRR